MKRRIEIDLEGDTEGDLELALAEVVSKVKQGFTSGHDSNDTGKYRFEVTGDTGDVEEDEEEDATLEWIPHTPGDSRPVDADVLVYVRMACGVATSTPRKAGTLKWTHSETQPGSDIVAWRSW